MGILLALQIAAIIDAACTMLLALFGKVQLGQGTRRMDWIGVR